MEKILSIFDSHEQAERAAREADNQMTCQERFDAFRKLMEPYYANAGRLQRVYRVDDLRQRTVCDDWGLRLQPAQKPRATGDIDFLVSIDPENQLRL